MRTMTNNDKKKLLSVTEVPCVFREPYIHECYRAPGSSARSCIISVFRWTNETMNVWTHLLPVFYFLYCGYSVFSLAVTEHGDHLFPLAVYSTSLVFYPLASAMAHVFNAMSSKARHICFFFDYYALGYYGFVSAMAYRAYSFPGGLGEFTNWYQPISGFVAVICFFMACYTRFTTPGWTRKAARFGAFAAPYLYDLLPIFIKIYICDIMFTDDISSVSGSCVRKTCTSQSYYHHKQQFLWAFFSAAFYCLHIPERWAPGWFDVFAHSHQLFHICTVIGSYHQMTALWLDAGIIAQPLSNDLKASTSFEKSPDFSNTCIRGGSIESLQNYCNADWFSFVFGHIPTNVSTMQGVGNDFRDGNVFAGHKICTSSNILMLTFVVISISAVLAHNIVKVLRKVPERGQKLSDKLHNGIDRKLHTNGYSSHLKIH